MKVQWFPTLYHGFPSWFQCQVSSEKWDICYDRFSTHWKFNKGNRGEKKAKTYLSIWGCFQGSSVLVILSQQFASSVLRLKELPLCFTLCHHEKMYICREDRWTKRCINIGIILSETPTSFYVFLIFSLRERHFKRTSIFFLSPQVIERNKYIQASFVANEPCLNTIYNRSCKRQWNLPHICVTFG